MSYHGILMDMEMIEDAIEALPTQCLYHGDKVEAADIGVAPLWQQSYDGACCATGKPALYRRRAEAALERLRENL
jgi:hypothetical protein